MEQEQDARVARLQRRINEALHEDLEATAESNFSEYMPDSATPLTERLVQAAQQRGVEGMEAALDEFDRLKQSEDLARLQHALMLFLSEHPAATELGLRIPPLAERNPSQILPSKREE
jgi:hypothetical protein